jgi:hypothetical protein
VAYIAGLIIAALFFTALHYFTELTKEQKILTSAILLGSISAAIAYNTYSNQQRDNMLRVVTKYKQGKTIKCNGKDVNSSLYSLSIGTYTFIGKKDTPNYAEMISASSCK